MRFVPFIIKEIIVVASCNIQRWQQGKKIKIKASVYSPSEVKS